MECRYPPPNEDEDSPMESSSAQEETESGTVTLPRDSTQATRLLETRLFHQYMTSTYHTLSQDGLSGHHLSMTIPRMAASCPYLLDSIHAFSALHLASVETDNRALWLNHAVRYQSQACAGLSKVLPEISPPDYEPAFVSSIIIMLFAMGSRVLSLENRTLDPLLVVLEARTLMSGPAMLFSRILEGGVDAQLDGWLCTPDTPESLETGKHDHQDVEKQLELALPASSSPVPTLGHCVPQRNWRQTLVNMLQPIRLGVLAILSLLLIAIHLPTANTFPLEFSERDTNAGHGSHGKIGPGKLGAVASESSICSRHGSDILEKGGNAADALVATQFCIGVVGMYHSGIGGGGFMLVRSAKGDYEFIDFRETAPAAAFEDMYKGNEDASIYGGLASGVPGEVRGLEHLHKKYGSLPWSTVVQPAIHTARHGFPVTEDLVKYMASAVGTGEDFLTKNPTWAIDFAPNGTRLGLGDTITRRRYADTLETIARRGADALYSGPIAETMINALQSENGTMTLEDLKNYTVAIRDISQINYRGYKITSTSAPSSGSIAMSILKILGTYKDFFTTEQSVNLSTHRLDEAMRFGYGERSNFGDPLFVDGMAKYEKEILEQSTIDDIRSKISDVRTQNVSVYDPAGLESLDTPGTSHIAVADHTGLAISVITTINLLFGSHIMVPETGIIMNNEMNDFSIPGSSNSFGYIPSVSNYVRPGKRPLSSITPAIVERPNGKLFLIAGSAGGSRIITATVQNIIHSIDQGLSAAKALAKPRLHDQLIPNQVSFEYTYDNATVASMKARGHNVTWVAPGQSTAQLIRVLPNGTFDAADRSSKFKSFAMHPFVGASLRRDLPEKSTHLTAQKTCSST
ncbi:transcriptional regulator family: Fungal Specific TF [Penicillium roqueforti]|nr:transcriptional regulator family: Fungal Specific TF [Penicillium roqueforti]KAI3163455.1 transcriptional regulator family: Fungal Specific TF [Penicillium roqueforti]KAI3244933.1 transcriptional regulator family: Fungal Specific TF [Penicillium roqueforti]KAI3279743.1 transcriptional regulator family: Fungal Specific TF [Penicillium roqueforti]